ncbi:hypothetical protein HDU76_006787 [Blyttiomyces sp. JEL0837]|nr:hypothetical protein HDU76_006787 [Blyttiomyces sp. JEL0837]
MNEISFLEASGVKRVLSQKEYTSKLRVGLRESDLHDIYKFFIRYQREKAQRKQLDLLDIAASIIESWEDVIFVDELDALSVEAGPAETYLAINYRTDQSILNLSNRILDILRFFFKEELDNMPKEVAAREGEGVKPVLFWERDSQQTKDRSSEQAILVKSKERKRGLQDWLTAKGFNGTVLTVLEAKGLEFNDVVLYNPFESESLANTNRMRVLYQFDKPESEQGVLPQFDAKIHFPLCLHLKELYVAVTRAKSRLLIIDDSNGRDVFQYLLRNHVKMTSVESERGFTTAVDAGSEAERWEVKGRQFKSERLWPEALRGLLRWRGIKLRRRRSLDKKVALEAARLHLGLVREYEKRRGGEGGDGALGEERLWSLREAARIFENAEFLDQAAECFKMLEDAERVVDCYVRGGNFEGLVKALRQYHEGLDVEIRDHLYEVAAKHFYSVYRKKALACLGGISNPDKFLDFFERDLRLGLLPVVGMVYVQGESPACSVDQLVANPYQILKVVKGKVCEMEEGQVRSGYLDETARFFMQRGDLSLFDVQSVATATEHKKLFVQVARMVKSQRPVPVEAYRMALKLELGLELSGSDEERDSWLLQVVMVMMEDVYAEFGTVGIGSGGNAIKGVLGFSDIRGGSRTCTLQLHSYVGDGKRGPGY